MADRERKNRKLRNPYPHITVIGEILFDLFEDKKRLGGAPFNFAYHLHRLGYPVHFLSRVGNDQNGHKILEILENMQFPINDIQVDKHHPTGTVKVHSDGSGDHRFEIVTNVAYDFFSVVRNRHIELVKNSGLIYFGTLMQRTGTGAQNVRRLLQERPISCYCLYDINLRPQCYSKEVIKASLMHANLLKLNEMELAECKRIFRSNLDDITFTDTIMRTFSIDFVSLTKGDQGSALYTSKNYFTTDTPPVENIVDSVGAGDAYTAMFAVGIMKQWPFEKILSVASDFASRICSINGAIPESDEFYHLFEHIIEGVSDNER